jgi:hypothetical protein
MSNKTPTPVLLDTDLLSKMVSEILTLVGAPATKKSACLNKVAAMIAGPKRNWGYLTSREQLVKASGPGEQFDGSTTEFEVATTGMLLGLLEDYIPVDSASHDIAKKYAHAYLKSRSPDEKPITDAYDVCDDDSFMDSVAYLEAEAEISARRNMNSGVQTESEREAVEMENAKTMLKAFKRFGLLNEAFITIMEGNSVMFDSMMKGHTAKDWFRGQRAITRYLKQSALPPNERDEQLLHDLDDTLMPFLDTILEMRKQRTLDAVDQA